MLIEQKEKDIIQAFKEETKPAILIHGCNCFNNMISELASRIKTEFPEAYYVDKYSMKGWLGKLGCYTKAKYDNKFVINAYIQYFYNKKEEDNIDYEALDNVLYLLQKDFTGYVFYMPKLENWEYIKDIIENRLAEVEVKVFQIETMDN